MCQRQNPRSQVRLSIWLLSLLLRLFWNAGYSCGHSEAQKVVVNIAEKYAIRLENLYLSVHPFVCALFSEVKRIAGRIICNLE